MTLIRSAAVVERYRCPEGFARLAAYRRNGASPGFFKFGEDVVCYGQCSWGAPSQYLDGKLVDASTVMAANAATPMLPFDPDEVLDNLRRERYVTSVTNSGNLRSRLVRAGRATYYQLRGVMPPLLRAYVKRMYLAGWEGTSFPRWPVDITVELLLERLLEFSLRTQKLTETPFIWFWPDGYNSCSVMTHDVETTAGRNMIEAVMELDKSAGIKASFQIIPEGRYTISETLLREIRSQGFEINVHDLNHDGRLFDDRQTFLHRARKINHYLREYGAVGYRTGVMYRNQDWYNAFECEYDMSVPNVAHLDAQHGGCCTVMPYFINKVLELPLTTVQDYFLFYILKDHSIDLWRRQIEMINRQHGMASFIVHPDYVIAERNLATFKSLLEHLAGLRRSGIVWFALPGQVNRWWRQRSRMRLVRHRLGWKIEGDGSERARVAYAYLRNGKLAFHTVNTV